MQRETMNKIRSLTRLDESSHDATRLAIHDRQAEENVKNIERRSESLSTHR
jgi:hypothetical protein